MKLLDTSTKRVITEGTMFENIGNRIKIFNIDREQIAEIPSDKARIIFNEKELYEN